MTPYSRRQLLVLLILLAVAGLGLAVGHWRRANPDLADHLEQLDRAAAPATSAPELGGRGPATRPAAEPEPRRSRRRGVTREAGPDERALPRAAAPPSAIDLNRSTAIDLMRLPGIGAALARRIVRTRETDGPFASVDDLRRVPGVSARRLEELRVLVSISD